MANNNLDPARLAKRVADQLTRFPRGKSLQWKIDVLKCNFEKQNFGNCCRTIIFGAEVALKVEEKLSWMEARLKNGERDERLRLKVELVRRKVERFHFLMHLLSVSRNPGEFAACVRTFNRYGRKLREESGAKDIGQSEAENIEESQAKDVEKTQVKEKAKTIENIIHARANDECLSAGDIEKTEVKAVHEEERKAEDIEKKHLPKATENVKKTQLKGKTEEGRRRDPELAATKVALQTERFSKTRQKQELKRMSAKASHQSEAETNAREAAERREMALIKQDVKRISKIASHQAVIRLYNRAYGQFVEWKGSWSKGRAFVVSKTGASVKNKRGAGRFTIAGDELAVQRAINMIVTQSLTAVASSNDYQMIIPLKPWTKY